MIASFDASGTLTGFTRTTYYLSGNPSCVEQLNSFSDILSIVWYDQDGGVSGRQIIEYDDRRQAIHRVDYDDAGNTLTDCEMRYHADGWLQIIIDYDSLGNKLSETEFDKDGNQIRYDMS